MNILDLPSLLENKYGYCFGNVPNKNKYNLFNIISLCNNKEPSIYLTCFQYLICLDYIIVNSNFIDSSSIFEELKISLSEKLTEGGLIVVFLETTSFGNPTETSTESRNSLHFTKNELFLIHHFLSLNHVELLQRIVTGEGSYLIFRLNQSNYLNRNKKYEIIFAEKLSTRIQKYPFLKKILIKISRMVGCRHVC